MLGEVGISLVSDILYLAPSFLQPDMQEEAPNNPQESKHRKFLEELSEQS